MDLINFLRFSYLGAALGVLMVYLTPPLRSRFLDYGARAAPPPSESQKPVTRSKTKEKKVEEKQKNILEKVLDLIADWKVPHDYFWSFYFMSVTLSPFWLGECFYLKGPLWRLVKDNTQPLTTANSMTFEQVKITWCLMLVQGCRRLYETLSLTKEDMFSIENTNPSKMFGGHWVLGLAFYTLTSIAIWIEGIPAIENHTPTLRDLIFQAPTFRTILGVLIFMLASGFQYDCHTYLAYLKNSKSTPDNPAERNADKKEPATVGDGEGEYKLPTHPAFQPLICPHYLAECLIYFSITIVAAPRGSFMNTTLACATIFVMVNLGVTADGTKAWYQRRFGNDAVEGKFRMVPGIW